MSFSRAAQKLFRTQSAVSKNISLLEQELGFMLFDRTGKKICHTDGGKLLYQFFQRSRDDYMKTLDSISSLRSAQSGTIRIGIVDTWSTTQFNYDIFKHFISVYPNICLQVSAFGVDEMLTALRRARSSR